MAKTVKGDWELLRDALTQALVKRVTLARELDVSKGLVSQWWNDEKPIPASRKKSIADILQRSYQDVWKESNPQLRKQSAANLKNPTEVLINSRFSAEKTSHLTHPDPEFAKLGWCFTLNPDGGRNYQGLEELIKARLIKEVAVQNIIDAKLKGGKTAYVRITTIDLKKSTEEYKRFLECLQFTDLDKHLTAAVQGSNKYSGTLKQGLDLTKNQRILRLLRIEDYGCTGLTGKESGNGPFANLIRDDFASSKSESTSAGFHGVGAKTMWEKSLIKTVLVSTRTNEQPDKLRFIGRTILPAHELEGKSYMGRGWLQCPDPEAEAKGRSIHVDQAVLKPLFLDRQLPEQVKKNGIARTGSSMLIISSRGLGEEDELDEPRKILEAYRDEILENCFPAILENTMMFELGHQVGGNTTQQEHVEVKETSTIYPFADAYEKSVAGEDDGGELQQGDTRTVDFMFRIPATRTDAPEFKKANHHTAKDTRARLAGRIATDEEIGHQKVNHVALIRGNDMVIKYQKVDGVIGGRKFFGVLRAGEALKENDGDTTQTHAETFLQKAEPYAHDNWTTTTALRTHYKRGYGAALRELWKTLKSEIREIVSPLAEGDDETPPILARLLNFSNSRIKKNEIGQLHKYDVKFSEKGAEVTGKIRIVRPQKDVLHEGYRIRAKIWAELPTESGKSWKPSWTKFKVDDKDAKRVDYGQKTGELTIRYGTGGSPVGFTAEVLPDPAYPDFGRCALDVKSSFSLPTEDGMSETQGKEGL